MPAVTFDTLRFVKTLKEAGIPEPQAEAFSTAVRESHETADLATKVDLREYESAIRGDLEKLDIGLRHEMDEFGTELRHEMKELETGLRHEIGDLRHEMKGLDLRRQGEMLLLKWMFGLLIVGMVTLLLKAFFGA